MKKHFQVGGGGGGRLPTLLCLGGWLPFQLQKLNKESSSHHKGQIRLSSLLIELYLYFNHIQKLFQFIVTIHQFKCC